MRGDGKRVMKGSGIGAVSHQKKVEGDAIINTK